MPDHPSPRTSHYVDTSGPAYRPGNPAAVTPYSPLGHRPELDVALARAQGRELDALLLDPDGPFRFPGTPPPPRRVPTDHPKHGERIPGGLWNARFCENDGRWVDCLEPADEDRCPSCLESWT